jgi:hypothetical protein
MANQNLGDAKKAKNDEFYTQYHDIEKEINAYLEYNPDVFRGKTVLLPCDDPEWSNFTKFFAQKFQDLGLKKLISTSYAPNSKPPEIPYQPTLFEIENEKFDEVKTQANGKIFMLTKDKSGDEVINIEDLEWTYLKGDGDFRSEEIMRLRDEADVIVTNPPFSLFREFLAWAADAAKDFVIIGNINAITYKEVFPLIKENKMWLGATNFNVGMFFFVPENFVYASTYKFDREIEGKKVSRVPGVCWYTTIDHGRRHEPIALMTEAENIKFSRSSGLRGFGYQKYDNYDAIEVPKVEAIPSDYTGVMGVPITFLSKYNPDQFEIVGNTEGFEGTPPTKTYTKKHRVVDGKRAKSNTGTMSGVVRRKEFGPGTYFDVGYPVQAVYKRILIRHKNLKKVSGG